jgi:hypothetical protein
MASSYVATGKLSNGRLIELDEPVGLADVKVRVSIEPLLPIATRPLQEVVASIRVQQAARGYSPPTREEVDRYLENERDDWDR